MACTGKVRHVLMTALLVVSIAGIPGCKKGATDDSGGTITVSGRVIGPEHQPLANYPVVITGMPPAATDANGAFTIAGVSTPYDITIVSSATKYGITYRGLTRPDPTLIDETAGTPTLNAATIIGTISGGAGFPQPASRISAVLMQSTDTYAVGVPNASTGVHSFVCTWVSPSTISGTLHALQYERGTSGMPSGYYGYGERAGVSLTAGAVITGQDVVMGTVTPQTLSGSITVPSGSALTNKTLTLLLGPVGRLVLGTEASAVATFAYTVPSVSGGTLKISASASGPSGYTSAATGGVAASATNVVLELPSPSVQTLPVEGATNVGPSTVFSWTPLASAVYLIKITGSASLPRFILVTRATSTSILDLSALSMGLPKGTSYTWTLFTVGPFASIDAAAGPNGYLETSASSFATITPGRGFTTAP